MNVKNPTRLGLFGSAFDPPHWGHRQLVQSALRQFNLDELFIIPTGNAWHKNTTLSAAQDRLAMTRLCFENVPRVRIITLELDSPTRPSYSIETLKTLQMDQPNAQWFLFIGQDQAEQFGRWKDAKEITEIAQVVVAQRNLNMTAAPTVVPRLNKGSGLMNEIQLDMPRVNISSTRIRECLSQGLSVVEMLQPEVMRYIVEQKLYKLMDNRHID